MSTDVPTGPTRVQAPVPSPRGEARLDAPAAPPESAPTPPPIPGAGYKRSTFWRIYDGIAEAIDRAVGWDKLPRPLAIAVLIGVRTVLRQQNLHDPNTRVPVVDPPPVPPRTPEHLVSRSVDGTHNDLDHPDMGMAGARFGRNIPLDAVLPVTDDALRTPSPREVSRRLWSAASSSPRRR